MSDSDDSDSDISELFAQVHASRSITNHPVQSDNDDDNDCLEVVDNHSSNRKSKKMTVEQKIAKIEHQNIIRKRQHETMAAHQEHQVDSDEDISESNRKRPADRNIKAHVEINIADDSSDDEAESSKKQVSLDQLRRQGIDQQNLSALLGAQQALQQLQQAQFHKHLHNMQVQAATHTLGAQLYPNSLYPPGYTQDPALLALHQPFINQILRLSVRTTIQTPDGSVSDVKNMVVEVESLQNLNTSLCARLLQELKLSPESATIMLRFQGRVVDDRRNAAFYQMTSDSLVEAIILLSGFETMKVTTKKNLGRPMKLVFRRYVGNGIDECIIITSMKEPFADMIEKYRASNRIDSRLQMNLMFDGLFLEPSTTPEMHDMEDEDLIDVVVK